MRVESVSSPVAEVDDEGKEILVVDKRCEGLLLTLEWVGSNG
jgi:hypothetical protein